MTEESKAYAYGGSRHRQRGIKPNEINLPLHDVPLHLDR